MAEPLPFHVSRWISEEIQETTFIPLKESIEKVVHKHIAPWSIEQISEYAEKYENEVFDCLGRITDELQKNGIETSFILDGEPGTAYIKGESVIFPQILSMIKEKTPKEFEEFCAEILERIGAKTQAIGKTGDGGVDFVATEFPVTNIPIISLKACYPMVIGQAKRYKDDNFVSLPEVRSFIGGALIKQDELKREYSRYGILSPVVYAFWTTSNFNAEAQNYSNQVGIWYLNGMALAQLANKLDMIKI
ncbi:MAG: restriction endonuclease [Anaerolineaceae bacterium]